GLRAHEGRARSRAAGGQVARVPLPQRGAGRARLRAAARGAAAAARRRADLHRGAHREGQGRGADGKQARVALLAHEQRAVRPRPRGPRGSGGPPRAGEAEAVMRVDFVKAIEGVLASDPSSMFVTGDLGYSALEGVAATYGRRFLNAGVAEQNMVGVAAG